MQKSRHILAALLLTASLGMLPALTLAAPQKNCTDAGERQATASDQAKYDGYCKGYAFGYNGTGQKSSCNQTPTGPGAPTGADVATYKSFCRTGFDDGQKDKLGGSAATGGDAGAYCLNLSPPYPQVGADTARSGFENGCVDGYSGGYSDAINNFSNNKDSLCGTAAPSGVYTYEIGIYDGCRQGYTDGFAAGLQALLNLPATKQCPSSISGTNAQYRSGCAYGYSVGVTGSPFPSDRCTHDISVSSDFKNGCSIGYQKGSGDFSSGAAPAPRYTGNKQLIVQFAGLTQNTVRPEVYINTAYRWGIGLAALLAVFEIVYGGVLYILAAGSLYSQEEATGKMKNAVSGLLLLLAISLILSTINPRLTLIAPDTNPQLIAQGQSELAKVSAQLQAGDAARAAELNKLRSGPSLAAANDALNRIQANSDQTYFDAYKNMVIEIDQQASRADDDLQEVVGDADTDIDDEDMPLSKLRQLVASNSIVVDDDAGGNDDFYKYAENSANAYAGGNTAQGDGYRDAVTAAVNYAINHLDKPTNHDDIPRMMLLISVMQPEAVKNIILEGHP